MKPEAIRIAIAEANGFSGPFGYQWLRGEGFEGEDVWAYCATKNGILQSVPNYPVDLNAMREAIAALHFPMQLTYTTHLARVVGVDLEDATRTENDFALAHASAAQQAQAYLRAFDKWVN